MSVFSLQRQEEESKPRLIGGDVLEREEETSYTKGKFCKGSARNNDFISCVNRDCVRGADRTVFYR